MAVTRPGSGNSASGGVIIPQYRTSKVNNGFRFPPRRPDDYRGLTGAGLPVVVGQQGVLRQSWAARVAQQQGWRFVTPDFPIPVLFDLEKEVRRLDTATIGFEGLRFSGLFGHVRDNLKAWLADTQTSAFSCFDNLGLAGCLVDDLYTRTARTSAAEIARLAPRERRRTYS